MEEKCQVHQREKQLRMKVKLRLKVEPPSEVKCSKSSSCSSLTSSSSICSRAWARAGLRRRPSRTEDVMRRVEDQEDTGACNTLTRSGNWTVVNIETDNGQTEDNS